jgi:four helix bundle protein
MNYKDLVVWQKSIAFVSEIYLLTKNFPQDERFSLVDQMRRAAVSIPSNIAEGHARKSHAEFARFLRISYGSAAEIETQLIIANNLHYLTDSQLQESLIKITELQKMLNALISKQLSN